MIIALYGVVDRCPHFLIDKKLIMRYIGRKSFVGVNTEQQKAICQDAIGELVFGSAENSPIFVVGTAFRLPNDRVIVSDDWNQNQEFIEFGVDLRQSVMPVEIMLQSMVEFINRR